MNKYVSPKIELIEFEIEDIIMTSGVVNTPLKYETAPVDVAGDSTIINILD